MSAILSNFQKPSRYLGNEVNIIRKDAEVKIALCFPDTYEIGMSHIGLKILYSIINNIPCASAERVYAPWIDFESYLRHNNLPLTSLENQRPLRDFDIIGFTLQYELSYTNILNMLDLGGIPIRAEERGNAYPLIIAGGPCAVNPLPLSPFIDAFVIGDGEEVIKEIIDIYSGCKIQDSRFKYKDTLLKALSNLEGVYVPSVHSHTEQKIRRRIIENLDEAPFPESPILPFASIVHDRMAIEISRGCSKGCRFCQAGIIYRPLRERSVENILSLSDKTLLNTGYEEISFSSLNTGDYSNLIPLLRTFNTLCSSYHAAISLPSLRVGSVSKSLLKEIKSVRKTGFTIAPEAGTKRLRSVINKDVTEEEYKETLEKLFTEGWKNIKLYFMIGLPTETEKDIEGIICMAETALIKGRKIAGRRVNINVGISAFVPKAHTPFQWFGQASYEELRAKQSLLRKAFSKKGVNFKGQHVELSLLEAVISRGGTDCAGLIEAAWKSGCRFDGWSETFDFSKWLNASGKAGIDLYSYASRTPDISAALPWDFIDTGVTKEFLKSEYQKALKEITTPDCRHTCSACGLKCNDRTQTAEQHPGLVPKRRDGAGTPQTTEYKIQKKDCPVSGLCVPDSNNSIKHSSETTASIKIRVRFSKTGVLRYLSHSEVMTALLRAMRRAGITLTYSAGFHPHPKISFGPALPVGVEGINEYFDIELSPSANIPDQLFGINACLPKGLEILAAAPIDKNKKSLNEFISRYEYEITIDKTMNESINSFMHLSNYPVTREGEAIDIRPLVESADINNGSLYLVLADLPAHLAALPVQAGKRDGEAGKNGTKVRLYEILKEILQKPVEKIQTIPIKRIRLYGYTDKGWTEP